MTDLNIERQILIDAPADVVWRTITEPDQISQWFADRVELELRPGACGRYVFEQSARTQPTTAALVVEAVDPPHRFAFRWGHSEGETANTQNSVLVEFTLSAEGSERTRLRVIETGFEGVDWPEEQKVRYTDDHRHGWEFHLGRLGELFATRTG
jgi:uncharacterized protein YndB with AHSA1/START domain